MGSTNRHPFSRARKVQALISLISWPFALATIFTTRYSPHAWIQLITITISSTMPIFILFRYRVSGSQSYSLIEIAVDALMALFLLAVYIAGIALLATQEISKWDSPWDYRLALGIPQIYSNLSCILLCPLYLRCFAQGYLHRCIKPMLKAGCVNYTLCPACDQSVDAPVEQSQEITMTAGEQGRSSVSTDSFRGLYTGDVESQPLLPEISLGEEGKQTTGIVTNN
ncbi:hypothetical protein N7516_009604 [Penicillium verrucosum]|uniref:uncharacterized protein n=1 Tax=Penicillium verrucosum TaxID=60171 RepID=UPI0025456696|nr:uncharacterized protein N7516_009604 [Penicillium verrucosum]KAJ5921901.1 hypothetical protein N7516_009604 [Penicillium verrucosum]